MRFIVIVENKETHSVRAFGVYRSQKQAGGDAQAWNGYVVPLEAPDAEQPWNADFDINPEPPPHTKTKIGWQFLSVDNTWRRNALFDKTRGIK